LQTGSELTNSDGRPQGHDEIKMNPKSIDARDALDSRESGFPCLSFYFFVQGYKGTAHEFLAELGLANYREADSAATKYDFIFVCQQGEWMGLMENWGMRFAYSKKLRRMMDCLSQRYRTIAAWVGDCDHTVGFRFFEEGQLRRSYVKGDPAYGDPSVIENIGEAFVFENQFENFSDESHWLPFVAGQIGVPCDFTEIEKIAFVRQGTWSRIGSAVRRLWLPKS
jgi:hypothetical protein